MSGRKFNVSVLSGRKFNVSVLSRRKFNVYVLSGGLRYILVLSRRKLNILILNGGLCYVLTCGFVRLGLALLQRYLAHTIRFPLHVLWAPPQILEELILLLAEVHVYWRVCYFSASALKILGLPWRGLYILDALPLAWLRLGFGLRVLI